MKQSPMPRHQSSERDEWSTQLTQEEKKVVRAVLRVLRAGDRDRARALAVIIGEFDTARAHQMTKDRSPAA